MDLRGTSLAFYRAWHIAHGVRHGLLLALRDVALDASDLADELGLAQAPVEHWCEGAWALDLVTRDKEDRYRLARAHMLTLGEPTSTEYLGHHFEYLAQKSLTFGALDDAFAGRAPAVDLADIYAIATRYDHTASLAALPPSLLSGLRKGIDVLDLGAGRGGWTRAAMAQFPASRFSAADLDTKPLRDLPGARVLDARRLPRAAYDLVYLGEVLAAARDPATVLQAAFRALRPGGHLYALEGLRPGTKRVPQTWGERLVLAMALDLSMDGTRSPSRKELKGALTKAGFPRARIVDLGGSLFSLHARKPQTRTGE